MNGTDNDRRTNEQEDMNDPLAELFRHASARQRPPAGDEQYVRQHLHEQWQAMTRRPNRRRRIWPWAIAASIVLAVAAGIKLSPVSGPAAPAQPVAFADRVVGQFTLHTTSGARVMKEVPARGLLSGQTVSLGKGSRLAMRWFNGSVIRMDENTELRLISENEVFLATGRIYMDTAPAGQTGGGITVSTPQGLVRHLGTQFVTHVTPSGTSVSVREGQVAYFSTAGRMDKQALAGRGQQLAVDADGRVAIEPIDTWGAAWEWAEQMASGFVSDGRSLADLLAWAGRESGRQVQYDSANAESIATATILHGDLRDLQPMQALLVASATSDLQAEVSEGLIVVHLQAKN